MQKLQINVDIRKVKKVRVTVYILGVTLIFAHDSILTILTMSNCNMPGSLNQHDSVNLIGTCNICCC